MFVDRAGVAPIPAGAVSDGAFVDPPAIVNAIQELCQDLGLRGKRVALSLTGEDVFVVRLKLEETEAGSLETKVREETARLAPFPLDQAKLDYQVLENWSNSEWVQALAVAARKRPVERLQELMRRAAKTPVVVDATACALVNAYAFNYEPGPSEIVALAHLGASWMTVCIVRGSIPLLAKDLWLGSSRYTEEEQGLTERIVVHLERVFEWVDDIADEYPLEPRSSAIRRLLLSGGVVHLQGLQEALRKRMRLPIEEMNPFRTIEFEGSGGSSSVAWKQAHLMPVAVGLALRAFDQES